MVCRVARGWIVRDAFGHVVAGPYYSREYAENRDREATQARQARNRAMRIKMKYEN